SYLPQAWPRSKTSTTPSKLQAQNTLINALKRRKPVSVAPYDRVDRMTVTRDQRTCVLEGERRRTGDSPDLAKEAKEYLDDLAKRLTVGYTMSAAEATVVDGCFARWTGVIEDMLDTDMKLRH
ncbi:MAG: hypothetical protein Q9180_009511, partial [Flavoplaca navasiana]